VIPSSRKNAVCDSAELTAEELLEDYDPPITLGSCLLRQPVNAELVANAIRFFDKKRYELPAWCVMPNHVHAIVSPYAGHSLGKILHSWKSFTSHELKKLLNREGSTWERESFDHLVRSEKSLEAFVEYVEQNPVKAGLVRRAEDWPFSSAGRVEV
jgi:REP element-mobilizing transposase RayT